MLDNIPNSQFVENKFSYFDSYTRRHFLHKQDMKLTTFLSEIFNNPEFDIELSKIIEQTKIKGCITISIDPNDFLTMSFNQSGWQSCHTIAHGGEARDWGEFVGGIFSYIEDKHTAISFRHNGKKVEFPIGKAKIQDYSKNWRELLYIDTRTNAFVASRQYPSYNEEISKNVRDLLETQISNQRKIANSWKAITSESSSYFENYLTDGIGSLQYNDMLNGFRGKMIYNKELNNLENVEMVIGTHPICPVCGENHIDENNRPMCDSCYYKFVDEDDEDEDYDD